jgi:hypothetical protein
MLRREKVRPVLKGLFRIIEHCCHVSASTVSTIKVEAKLTKYSRVLWLPPRGIYQHTDALDHHADRKRVICSAWTRKGTIEMRIHEHSIRLSLFRAITKANDDIAQVDVTLVQACGHHVKTAVQTR